MLHTDIVWLYFLGGAFRKKYDISQGYFLWPWYLHIVFYVYSSYSCGLCLRSIGALYLMSGPERPGVDPAGLAVLAGEAGLDRSAVARLYTARSAYLPF